MEVPTSAVYSQRMRMGPHSHTPVWKFGVLCWEIFFEAKMSASFTACRTNNVKTQKGNTLQNSFQVCTSFWPFGTECSWHFLPSYLFCHTTKSEQQSCYTLMQMIRMTDTQQNIEHSRNWQLIVRCPCCIVNEPAKHYNVWAKVNVS